jgi:O-antigen ligase
MPFLLLTFFLLFLLSSLISGLFIQEAYWRLVFLRNSVVYTAAFLLFLTIYNTIRSKEDMIKILWALCIMGFLASLAGLLVLVNLIPLKSAFVAPISQILPESIKNSEYFSTLLNPVFGDIIQVFGIRMKRISSFLPYPNIFAAILIMVIPFQILLYKISHGLKKIFLFLSLPLLLINLAWTFSRGAILALIVSFFVFVFHYSLIKKSIKRVMVLTGLVVGVCLFVIFILSYTNTILYEVNPMSMQIRTFIFEKSIDSWKESPMFGWGTQRNIEVVGGMPNSPQHTIPALGTHSHYLSLLYRYGLVGLTLFALIYWLVFREIYNPLRTQEKDPFWLLLLMYCGWAFSANMIHALFIEMDFDVILFFIIWLNWALIFNARKSLEKSPVTSCP